MAEVILPPVELEPELPEEQLPEIDKPTELSKVITVKFNPLDTGMTSTANTRQSFYTTDTDAWIVFEIENMDAPNGSYSLVLYNKSDGSVFQRTGDIVSGAAYYKIEEEEIKHAGDWVGQVVITLANGKTTTSRFSFNVAGHLLDGKDVRQIVIQDFETLMKQLEDLKNTADIDINVLKSNIEEAQRLAKESEVARQETFEANESERIAAEDERKQAELLREETFDSKVDAAIVEADVVTKVDDKVAELSPTIQNVTAQLAQTVDEVNKAVSKVTVDSEVILARGGKTTLGVRLDESDERLDVNDGRIAEIEEDFVVNATNMLKNSGFSSADGWSVSGATLDEVANNQATYSATGINGGFRQSIRVNNNHVYYMIINLKASNNKFEVYMNGSEQQRHSGNGDFEKLSGKIKATTDSNYLFGTRYVGLPPEPVTATIKEALLINLSETFGIGNEPTTVQMEKLLKQFPNSWFEGTVNIYNSKHMMNIFFKELTKLNNAVIALGGNV